MLTTVTSMLCMYYAASCAGIYDSLLASGFPALSSSIGLRLGAQKARPGKLAAFCRRIFKIKSRRRARKKLVVRFRKFRKQLANFKLQDYTACYAAVCLIAGATFPSLVLGRPDKIDDAEPSFPSMGECIADCDSQMESELNCQLARRTNMVMYNITVWSWVMLQKVLAIYMKIAELCIALFKFVTSRFRDHLYSL
mmetsp:Transcript_13087/g.21793  ORF Transcript_13087/g.21793 Transcript_13087/m.21793 type:complete len:196 (+) Transcript_13087:57-644(+)